MTSQRKLAMVGTGSTVEKRAKRTPDITVETTFIRLPLSKIHTDSSIQKKIFHRSPFAHLFAAFCNEKVRSTANEIYPWAPVSCVDH